MSNATINRFFWGQNVDHIKNILAYEFNLTDIENASYLNDQCPSLLITLEKKKFNLYLPSDYEGDYAEFCLFDVTDTEDITEGNYIGHYSTILEVIKELNKIVY